MLAVYILEKAKSSKQKINNSAKLGQNSIKSEELSIAFQLLVFLLVYNYVVVQVQYFKLVQFILIHCNISCTGTSCLELYKPVCFFQTSLFFSYIFFFCLRPITSDTSRGKLACQQRLLVWPCGDELGLQIQTNPKVSSSNPCVFHLKKKRKKSV